MTLYRPRKVPGGIDRPDMLRVVCSRRNLTTSHCWEAFVALAGEVGSSKTASPVSSGVRAFLGMLKAVQPSRHPQSSDWFNRWIAQHLTFPDRCAGNLRFCGSRSGGNR